MRRKSTILSVAVTVMISLCLMLTGRVGFDTPAFAADKSKVYEIKLVTKAIPVQTLRYSCSISMRKKSKN